MADTVADPSQPWYRSLNATQWKTLFASNLGWMFDGYETFALDAGGSQPRLVPPDRPIASTGEVFNLLFSTPEAVRSLYPAEEN